MDNDESSTFGTHTLSQHGLATTTIGSDTSGKPFIQFAAISSGNYAPQVGAGLYYYWKITNNSNLSGPVLVHISTSGWINSIYGFTGQIPNTLYGGGYVPNVTGGYVAASFRTNNGLDQRSYGLEFGPYNMGVTSIDSYVSDFTKNTLTVHGEFSNTFDIWVYPNLENYIQLGAEAIGGLPFESSQFSEYFAITGYIDPVITIDSAYSSNYTLEVSNIPFAPVPVPGAVWLFGSGLLGFLGLKHSRRV